MKTRHTLFILLFLLPCSTNFAQSAQTILKMDTGSVLADTRPAVGRPTAFGRAGISRGVSVMIIQFARHGALSAAANMRFIFNEIGWRVELLCLPVI